MRNLLLTLRYNGSRYHGWQVQKNALAIQQVVQDAIEAVFGKREDVIGCSRTDTGVHANAYCMNLHTENLIPCERVVPALNRNLPQDIAVISCREVPEEFHARYHVVKKEYLYVIHNSPAPNPFLPGLCYEYPYPLDEAFLNQAAKAFLGTHDFKAFCAAGSSVEGTVRTIYESEVFRKGEFVIFRVCGNGFLYNMVRIMTGTLLQAHQGKIDWEKIPDIIASGDRSRAGKTAAAKGLYLNRVEYEDQWFATDCNPLNKEKESALGL